MPDANGVEVAERARCIDPGMPVVFVTGNTDLLDEPPTHPPCFYLVKPVSMASSWLPCGRPRGTSAARHSRGATSASQRAGGPGRGGGDSRFGYAESNENLVPYGLLRHVHMPEMARTTKQLSGGGAAGLVFTPRLVPMTRCILSTIYCRGRVTTEQCLEAARPFYAGRFFVRVTDRPPQTK
jgi:hypothetical protein